MSRTASPPYLIFIHWLIMINLTAFGIYLGYDSGLLTMMLWGDNTRLSVLICILFLLGCAHCAERSWFISRQTQVFWQQRTDPHSPISHYLANYPHHADKSLLSEVLVEELRGQHQLGWFLNGVLIKLGLLGTVIGFVLMVGSLNDITSMDIQQVQTLMQKMTQGMGIALYTTLFGLFGSLLLGLQYLYLDRCIDSLVSLTIHKAQAVSTNGAV